MYNLNVYVCTQTNLNIRSHQMKSVILFSAALYYTEYSTESDFCVDINDQSYYVIVLFFHFLFILHKDIDSNL